jgi:hypothetical protein
MSDMRRDLEELGAALWPDTNELRPGSAAATRQQRNSQRRHRGLEPAVTATAAVLLIAALVAAFVLGRATSPYVANPVPAKPIVSVASVTAAELAKGRWSQLPPAPIDGRTGSSVVWTGTELLVWGGQSVAAPNVTHADGAAYNPQTGRWRTLPAAPLSPRFEQVSAWDGAEMLVWGGYDGQPRATDRVANDGAAYDSTTNRWRPLPPAPLSARAGAIAVWTGSTMVVLGGYADGSGQVPRDGAAYNPATDRWTPIPAPTPPGQHSLMWASAVQAGSELLAFSDWATSTPCGFGCTEGAGGTDVYAHDVHSDGWHLVPAASGALSGADHVFWTGSVVIARGGDWCGGCAGPAQPQRTAAYDPTRNTWTQLPADPVAWAHPLSAWTGAALFSFNPATSQQSQGPSSGVLNPGDATAYDPHTGWVHLPSAPSGCGDIDSPPPIWTGQQVLLVCGSGPIGLALTPVPSGSPAQMHYIPWLPMPAANVNPQPTLDPATSPVLPVPLGTPACRAGQLEGVYLGFGAAAGNRDSPIEMRNRSGGSCALRGYPDISIVDRSGRVLARAAASSGQGSYFDDRDVVPVLMKAGTPPLPRPGSSGQSSDAPLGQAHLDIQWVDCSQPQATQLTVDLPSGGGRMLVPYVVKGDYNPGCPGGPSSLTRGPWVPTGFPWPPTPPTLDVAITISSPASAQRGSALTYYVTVTNRSSQSYNLSECPDYFEYVGIGKSDASTFQLNCGPVRQIGQSVSVVFQMKFVVPPTTPVGPNTLRWSLIDGRIAFTSLQAAIDITG